MPASGRPPTQPDSSSAKATDGALVAATAAAAAVGPAAVGAASLAGVAALGAGALLPGAAAAAAAAVESSLDAFYAKRFTGLRRELVTRMRIAHPDAPTSALEQAIDAEIAREREFQDRSRARWQREVPGILAQPADRREAAMRTFLSRERHYAKLREEALLSRVSARLEQVAVQARSPLGAFWTLDPRLKTHTLDCMAMSGKFWPWSVVDKVRPPLHGRCGCRLWPLDEAVKRGWMRPDQVPDEADAINRVNALSRDIPELRRALLSEGVDERTAIEVLREADRFLNLGEAPHRPDTHPGSDHAHRAAPARYPKGFSKGGQFRPRDVYAPGVPNALRRSLRRVGRPTAKAGRRRGEWRTVEGRRVFVPEADSWHRTINGKRFVSPPQSTEVYPAPPAESPGIPQPVRDAADAVRDQWRVGRLREMRAREARGEPPLREGDDVAWLSLMDQLGYRRTVSDLTPEGRTDSFRRDSDGRGEVVTSSASTVLSARRLDAPAPSVAHEGAPKDWEGFREDMLGYAGQLGKRFGATNGMTDFREDPAMGDVSGRRTWDGVTRVGPEARTVLEELWRQRAAHPDRDAPDPFLAEGYIATQVSMHEAAHAVNPEVAYDFQNPDRRWLEEGLVEELSRQEAADRLKSQGQLDVLGWMARNPGHDYLGGNYSGPRWTLAHALDRAGVAPEDRRGYLENLKYRIAPDQRLPTLARDAAKHNGTSEEAERQALEGLFADPNQVPPASWYALPTLPGPAAELAEAPPGIDVGGRRLASGATVGYLPPGKPRSATVYGDVDSLVAMPDGTYNVIVHDSFHEDSQHSTGKSFLAGRGGTVIVRGVRPGAGLPGLSVEREAQAGDTGVRAGDRVTWVRPDGRETHGTADRVLATSSGWAFEATTDDGVHAVVTDRSVRSVRSDGPAEPAAVDASGREGRHLFVEGHGWHFVPEGEDWSLAARGHTYTSPAGSTDVYRDGVLVSQKGKRPTDDALVPPSKRRKKAPEPPAVSAESLRGLTGSHLSGRLREAGWVHRGTTQGAPGEGFRDQWLSPDGTREVTVSWLGEDSTLADVPRDVAEGPPEPAGDDAARAARDIAGKRGKARLTEAEAFRLLTGKGYVHQTRSGEWTTLTNPDLGDSVMVRGGPPGDLATDAIAVRARPRDVESAATVQWGTAPELRVKPGDDAEAVGRRLTDTHYLTRWREEKRPAGNTGGRADGISDYVRTTAAGGQMVFRVWWSSDASGRRKVVRSGYADLGPANDKAPQDTTGIVSRADYEARTAAGRKASADATEAKAEMRRERTRLRIARGEAPYREGESIVDADMAALGLSWDSVRRNRRARGGYSLALRVDGTGAKLNLQGSPHNIYARRAGEWKVLRVTRWDPGSFGRERKRLDRPARNPDEAALDALARADELAAHYGAPAHASHVAYDRGQGFAGVHRWDGSIGVGKQVKQAIEDYAAMRAGETANRPDYSDPNVRDDVLARAYEGYETLQHEVVHAVGNLTPGLYKGPGISLEEGMTEELAHVLLDGWLHRLGMDDVRLWARDHPRHRYVQGTYTGFREMIRTELDLAKVPPDRRGPLLEDLSFRAPAADRLRILGELQALAAHPQKGPHPDPYEGRGLHVVGRWHHTLPWGQELTDTEEGDAARRNIVSRMHVTSSRSRRNYLAVPYFSPVLRVSRPDLGDSPEPFAVSDDGVPLRYGDVAAREREIALPGQLDGLPVLVVGPVEPPVRGQAPAVRYSGANAYSGRLLAGPALDAALAPHPAAGGGEASIGDGVKIPSSVAYPGHDVQGSTDATVVGVGDGVFLVRGRTVQRGSFEVLARASDVLPTGTRGASFARLGDGSWVATGAAVTTPKGPGNFYASAGDGRLIVEVDGEKWGLEPRDVLPGPSPWLAAPLSPGRPRAPHSLDEVRASHPGVEFQVSERDGLLSLSLLRVPDAERGQGRGEAALTDLLAYADARGLDVSLTPSPLRGDGKGPGKGALTRWYRDHGFVANTGRNKDWRTRDTLVRPAPVDEASPGRPARYGELVRASKAVEPTEAENLALGLYDAYGWAGAAGDLESDELALWGMDEPRDTTPDLVRLVDRAPRIDRPLTVWRSGDPGFPVVAFTVDEGGIGSELTDAPDARRWTLPAGTRVYASGHDAEGEVLVPIADVPAAPAESPGRPGVPERSVNKWVPGQPGKAWVWPESNRVIAWATNGRGDPEHGLVDDQGDAIASVPGRDAATEGTAVRLDSGAVAVTISPDGSAHDPYAVMGDADAPEPDVMRALRAVMGSEVHARQGRAAESPGRPSGRGRVALDALVRALGADYMETDREHRPDLYTMNANGFEVRNDRPATELVTQAPREYVTDGKGEFPKVADFVPGPAGLGRRRVSGERPLPYVFRATSEDEWKAAQEQGFVKSDGRMNLAPYEGTVASIHDPSFYLPGHLASDPDGEYPGRILRIAARRSDGWYLDRDGYVKTQKAVPIDRVTASPPIVTTRRTGGLDREVGGYRFKTAGFPEYDVRVDGPLPEPVASSPGLPHRVLHALGVARDPGRPLPPERPDTPQQAAALRRSPAARKARALYPRGTRVESTSGPGGEGRGHLGTVARHVPDTNAQGGSLVVLWDNGETSRISPGSVRAAPAEEPQSPGRPGAGARPWEWTPDQLRQARIEGYHNSWDPADVFDPSFMEGTETLHSVGQSSTAPTYDPTAKDWDLHELLDTRLADYRPDGTPYNFRTRRAPQALVDAIKADRPITVYRAVDPELADQPILPGAYVTESRAYAQQHGEGNMNGRYVVQSLTVKPSELASLRDPHEFHWAPATPERALEQMREWAAKHGAPDAPPAEAESPGRPVGIDLPEAQRWLNEPPPGAPRKDRPVTRSATDPWLQTSEEFAADPATWWHGTVYPTMGEGDPGLIHLGDWQTAHEALAARVAGRNAGDPVVPEVARVEAPRTVWRDKRTGMTATFAGGKPVEGYEQFFELVPNPLYRPPFDAHPRMVPVRVVGPMARGVRRDTVGDYLEGEPGQDGPPAESIMRGQLKRGVTPRQGYFYLNQGEGTYRTPEGAPEAEQLLAYPISAVVPSGDWLRSHRDYVADALRRGEAVPDRVLAEYPDLRRPRAAESPGRPGKAVSRERALAFKAAYDGVQLDLADGSHLEMRVEDDGDQGIYRRQGGGWVVEGSIHDADGRDVGTFRRSLLDARTARKDLVWLDPAYRGRGFARALDAHDMAVYRDLGVRRVELTTDDDGGYVWARLGYRLDTDRALSEMGETPEDLAAQVPWKLDPSNPDELRRAYLWLVLATTVHDDERNAEGDNREVRPSPTPDQIHAALDAVQHGALNDVTDVAASPNGRALLSDAHWEGYKDVPAEAESPGRPTRVLYHVAPRTARESIRRHGLDPARGEFRSEDTPGVYAFTDRSEAGRYAAYQQGESVADGVPMKFDIWKVHTDAAGAPDAGVSSTGDAGSAVYLDRTLPPEALALDPPVAESPGRPSKAKAPATELPKPLRPLPESMPPPRADDPLIRMGLPPDVADGLRATEPESVAGASSRVRRQSEILAATRLLQHREDWDDFADESHARWQAWREVDTDRSAWTPPESVAYAPAVKAIATPADAEAYLKGLGVTARLTPPDTEQGRNLAADADWFRQIAQAVTDAMDRYPVLREGPHRLGTVALFSDTPLREGLPPEQASQLDSIWAATGIALADVKKNTALNAVPLFGRDGAPTPEELKGLTTDIVISDVNQSILQTRHSYDTGLSQAAVTPYGRMMHELGHAAFAATGQTDKDLAAREPDPFHTLRDLVQENVSPERAASVSDYAASSVAEAWAEFFATLNVPHAMDRLRTDDPLTGEAIDRLAEAANKRMGAKVL